MTSQPAEPGARALMWTGLAEAPRRPRREAPKTPEAERREAPHKFPRRQFRKLSVVQWLKRWH